MCNSLALLFEVQTSLFSELLQHCLEHGCELMIEA